jgi:hypothetical protein
VLLRPAPLAAAALRACPRQQPRYCCFPFTRGLVQFSP